ncbi:fzo-like region [Ancylostoma ceylanicum]|uniref:Fzo-like region n=1 Tax=Ancylostoma ceylanicum TaxID=53326 RepID=A0A0D6LTT2_9BILA|nr:fzo-like region [Ancylostoma ceylanicum]
MNGEAEPLLRFAEAKKVLGEIYTDLGKHVDELDEVYKGIVEPTGGGAGDSECMVPDEQAAEIELFRESINTIMETFRRDNMKVVFFGRTSNGKSTTINAMLHAKILPQGMGHTTCCFLQVKQQHLTRFRQFLVNELEVATDRDVKDRIFFVSSRERSTQVFNDCRMNFAQFERAYREQTERLRAEVHLKVSADFSEEIMRLEAIVDRFNMPFLDTTQGIIEYKRALAEFTDKCVSSDLEARCTGGLMSRIWNLENDMFQYVTKILAEPYQHKLEEVWRYRAPFKFSICVDAPALTKDFHEDLEFRFTFGLSAIIRRIIAYRSGQPVTAIQANLLTPMALRNAGRSNEDLHNEAMQKAVEENAMMTQMVLTSASYLANGSIGLLVVGGIVYRAVGWRVIAVTAAAYGGLYVWERMRWNSHAKEQHLKEQFRSHLAARMQQVGAAHTTHCETQAMR